MSKLLSRFFISGILITLISMLCFFWLAHYFGDSTYYPVCCGCLYFLISGINFFIQKKWVFSSHGNFFYFFLVNFALALIFFLLQYFFVMIYGGKVLGLIGVFVYLCISFIMFPVSFFFNKRVFGRV